MKTSIASSWSKHWNIILPHLDQVLLLYCSWLWPCQSLWPWRRCSPRSSPCWPPPCPPCWHFFFFKFKLLFLFIWRSFLAAALLFVFCIFQTFCTFSAGKWSYNHIFILFISVACRLISTIRLNKSKWQNLISLFLVKV